MVIFFLRNIDDPKLREFLARTLLACAVVVVHRGGGLVESDAFDIDVAEHEVAVVIAAGSSAREAGIRQRFYANAGDLFEWHSCCRSSRVSASGFVPDASMESSVAMVSAEPPVESA